MSLLAKPTVEGRCSRRISGFFVVARAGHVQAQADCAHRFDGDTGTLAPDLRGTSHWRNPERISTFADPVLRAKIAGTTTIGDARLTDILAGYQLLAGVDYRLREPVTLGVRFRWVDFGEFRSEPLPWNQLRSHESSVGRGETVLYQMTMDASQFWGVSLNLKYRF